MGATRRGLNLCYISSPQDTQIQRRLEDTFVIFQPSLLSTNRRGVSARQGFVTLQSLSLALQSSATAD